MTCWPAAALWLYRTFLIQPLIGALTYESPAHGHTLVTRAGHGAQHLLPRHLHDGFAQLQSTEFRPQLDSVNCFVRLHTRRESEKRQAEGAHGSPSTQAIRRSLGWAWITLFQETEAWQAFGLLGSLPAAGKKKKQSFSVWPHLSCRVHTFKRGQQLSRGQRLRPALQLRPRLVLRKRKTRVTS